MGIIKATRAYEARLARELGPAFVHEELCQKHKAMAQKDPFPFLRATYYLWANEILNICPELAGAPTVVAVGDIHLENFGTWRDNDGRLIWGVNDFDEAAEMPYALDLVRLGVSAVLGCPHIRSTSICDNILTGYQRGLQDPHPIVLDDKYAWLRNALVVTPKTRRKFWEDRKNIVNSKQNKPPKEYGNVLEEAMPKPRRDMKYGERTGAGLGSLGRARWIAMAQWCGGPVVREAKAALPSAWTLPKGRSKQPMYCFEIATASYRAPDPWYRLVGEIVVRRSSPNSRKLDLPKGSRRRLHTKMLRLMGRELGAVHLGLKDHRAIVRHDIDARNARDPKWLHSAIKNAVKFIRDEHREWKKSYKRKQSHK